MDRVIILAALFIVIIVGGINRRVGGVLGMIFTAGLTYWGLGVLKSGGMLYILKFNLSQNVFLIIMGSFFLYNLFLAVVGDRREKN
ncbi:MAG: hypothetical protein ACP5QK_04715 [Myxococcota bacterium]